MAVLLTAMGQGAAITHKSRFRDPVLRANLSLGKENLFSQTKPDAAGAARTGQTVSLDRRTTCRNFSLHCHWLALSQLARPSPSQCPHRSQKSRSIPANTSKTGLGRGGVRLALAERSISIDSLARVGYGAYASSRFLEQRYFEQRDVGPWHRKPFSCLPHPSRFSAAHPSPSPSPSRLSLSTQVNTAVPLVTVVPRGATSIRNTPLACLIARLTAAPVRLERRQHRRRQPCVYPIPTGGPVVAETALLQITRPARSNPDATLSIRHPRRYIGGRATC